MQPSKIRIRKLNLTESDKSDILNPNGWLTDRVIDAVNQIIGTHVGNSRNQSTFLFQT